MSTTVREPRHSGIHALLHEALSPEACAAWIERTEALGYGQTGDHYPASYRDNDRLVFDDSALAELLMERMRPSLPEELEHAGGRWRLVGLNERFRCCRYRGGQSFAIHRDGPNVRSQDTRSLLTFMVYLNSRSGPDGFSGGATRFYASRDASQPPLTSVAPRAGGLIVFQHDAWHDGEPVHGGTKYVLRSDVIYQRLDGGETPGAGHAGYVWCAAAEPSGSRLASGGRDGTVRIWKREGDALVELQCLRTRGPSVTALAWACDGWVWSGSRDGSLRRHDDSPSGLSTGWTSGAGDPTILSLIALEGGGVAVADAAGRVVLRDRRSRVVTERTHTDWAWALARSGDRLFSGSEDGTVSVWSLPTLEPVATLEVGVAVRALAAGAEGLVALGTSAGDVLSWRPGAPPTWLGRHQGAVRALSWLPDGSLASGGEDDRVRLWGDRPRVLRTHGDFVTSLVQEGDALVSTSYDGTLRFGE